jgi:Protein of unknown function (DUF3738)
MGRVIPSVALIVAFSIPIFSQAIGSAQASFEVATIKLQGFQRPRLSDPASPSIFTAIQEQLGLRLEPLKVPADFIVIDHVERPTPN